MSAGRKCSECGGPVRRPYIFRCQPCTVRKALADLAADGCAVAVVRASK